MSDLSKENEIRIIREMAAGLSAPMVVDGKYLPPRAKFAEKAEFLTLDDASKFIDENKLEELNGIWPDPQWNETHFRPISLHEVGRFSVGTKTYSYWMAKYPGMIFLYEIKEGTER